MTINEKSRNEKRCDWVTDEPLYINYHDHEWGVPIVDSQKLFEFLILEGMQAGLSWLTILKKRDSYRQCFDHFNPIKIAVYDQNKVNQLLGNSSIIRNRLKIEAIISNAKAYIAVQKECGSFSEFIWQFVNFSPIQNHWKTIEQVQASTPLSETMSKKLKKRGFKFVGPTICYAFMQAVGMVNDHVVDCFCYDKIVDLPLAFEDANPTPSAARGQVK